MKCEIKYPQAAKMHSKTPCFCKKKVKKALIKPHFSQIWSKNRVVATLVATHNSLYINECCNMATK